MTYVSIIHSVSHLGVLTSHRVEIHHANRSQAISYLLAIKEN
jgi:hypothetical protein